MSLGWDWGHNTCGFSTDIHILQELQGCGKYPTVRCAPSSSGEIKVYCPGKYLSTRGKSASTGPPKTLPLHRFITMHSKHTRQSEVAGIEEHVKGFSVNHFITATDALVSSYHSSSACQTKSYSSPKCLDRFPGHNMGGHRGNCDSPLDRPAVCITYDRSQCHCTELRCACGADWQLIRAIKMRSSTESEEKSNKIQPKTPL